MKKKMSMANHSIKLHSLWYLMCTISIVDAQSELHLCQICVKVVLTIVNVEVSKELLAIKHRFSLCVEFYWIFLLLAVIGKNKFQCRTDANDNCIRYCDRSLCYLVASVHPEII